MPVASTVELPPLHPARRRQIAAEPVTRGEKKRMIKILQKTVVP